MDHQNALCYDHASSASGAVNDVSDAYCLRRAVVSRLSDSVHLPLPLSSLSTGAQHSAETGCSCGKESCISKLFAQSGSDTSHRSLQVLRRPKLAVVTGPSESDEYFPITSHPRPQARPIPQSRSSLSSVHSLSSCSSSPESYSPRSALPIRGRALTRPSAALKRASTDVPYSPLARSFANLSCSVGRVVKDSRKDSVLSSRSTSELNAKMFSGSA